MRRLYAVSTGEDRKQRLIGESGSRRKYLLEALRSAKTPSSSPPAPEFTFESFDELVDFLAMCEADKWIDKAIKKPGRCKDFGGPDCPEGSPQYNLAKRFKKGGDLYTKAHEG